MILHTVTIDLTRSGFFFFSRTSVITTLMLIPELNSGDCVFFFFFSRISHNPGKCGRYVADFQCIPDNRSRFYAGNKRSSPLTPLVTWPEQTKPASPRVLPTHSPPAPTPLSAPPACPHLFLQILPCLLTSSSLFMTLEQPLLWKNSSGSSLVSMDNCQSLGTWLFSLHFRLCMSILCDSPKSLHSFPSLFLCSYWKQHAVMGRCHFKQPY